MSNAQTLLPAVSVAVLRGDRVMLVKRGRKPAKGFYAFPGGRVEAGESDADAVRRELMEETGLEASNFRPISELEIPASEQDQAPGYRLVVFAATWIGGEPVAADDAEEARFFTRDEMIALPTTDTTLELALQLLEGSI